MIIFSVVITLKCLQTPNQPWAEFVLWPVGVKQDFVCHTSSRNGELMFKSCHTSYSITDSDCCRWQMHHIHKHLSQKWPEKGARVVNINKIQFICLHWNRTADILCQKKEREKWIESGYILLIVEESIMSQVRAKEISVKKVGCHLVQFLCWGFLSWGIGSGGPWTNDENEFFSGNKLLYT